MLIFRINRSVVPDVNNTDSRHSCLLVNIVYILTTNVFIYVVLFLYTGCGVKQPTWFRVMIRLSQFTVFKCFYKLPNKYEDICLRYL